MRDTNTNKIIAYNIKKARHSHSWSQGFVSRQTGISIRTISRLENNGSGTLKTLKKLCLFYQVPLKSLYENDTEGSCTQPDVELLSSDDVARLLCKSSFLADVQRETVLRFMDSVREEAAMTRQDIEDLIPQVITEKKTYTYHDLITCAMAANRRTIEEMSEMATG